MLLLDFFLVFLKIIFLSLKKVMSDVPESLNEINNLEEYLKSIYFDRLDKALNEDIPALINQQRGMNCIDGLPGRFQPQLEANVASFAFWYAGKW